MRLEYPDTDHLCRHSLLTRPAIASGHCITRNFLRVRENFVAEKTLLAFWVFLVSGLNHAIVDAVTSPTGNACLTSHLTFFIGNFAAISIEIFFRVIFPTKLPQWIRRGLGYAWAFCWFFWVVPKWKYASMHEQLRKEDARKVVGVQFTPYRQVSGQ